MWGGYEPFSNRRARSRLRLLRVRHLEHVPADDLALVHHVVDLGQVLEIDGLEGGADEAAGEEVERLGRVLAVADVGALDAHHLDHRLEHGRADVGLGWQADDDDGAAGAHVLGRLLEGFLVDGDQEYGVWAEAVMGCGAHVFGDVAGRGEVDEGLWGISFCRLSFLGGVVLTSAPICSDMALFESPESMAMTRRPMALAYCWASAPRPPPAPTMATDCPGRAPDSFNPL